VDSGGYKEGEGWRGEHPTIVFEKEIGVVSWTIVKNVILK
jgi:hypothetical protein